MSRGPLRDWFVPGEGIDRAVISGEIQRFLGAEATAIPGVDDLGNPGFWVRAFRGPTPPMIEDLQRRSAAARAARARARPPPHAPTAPSQPIHSGRPIVGRDQDLDMRDSGGYDSRRGPRDDIYSQSYQDRERTRHPDDRYSNDRNPPPGQRLPYDDARDSRYESRQEGRQDMRRPQYVDGPPQQPYNAGPQFPPGPRPQRGDYYDGPQGYPQGPGAPPMRNQMDPQYGGAPYSQAPMPGGREYRGGYPSDYDNDQARFYPTPPISNAPLNAPVPGAFPPGAPQYDPYSGPPGQFTGQPPQGRGPRPPPGPPGEPDPRRRRVG